VRKRVAWADPLPLHEVKALGKALGCTVNDILIAAITGALRTYLLEINEQQIDEIRATVPVNLRPLEHAKELGNHFGLVFLSLPVNEANPLERVYRVHERMQELKASKQATVAFGLLAALGMGPQALQKPALDLLSEKATMVLTNVPGPQQPLYLAGGEVRDMMFWVPQSGTIGMGVSILSYNGQIFFGLMTDRKLVNDPAKIIDRFSSELENLLHLAMMLPLGERPCRSMAEDVLRLGMQDPG
jgi:WS/DGAT/MGAT family acyltransferase